MQLSKVVDVQRRVAVLGFGGLETVATIRLGEPEVLGIGDEGVCCTPTTIGVDWIARLTQESKGAPPTSGKGGYHISLVQPTPHPLGGEF